MTLEQIVTWLLVGGIAGLLANLIVGGMRLGLLGTVVIGVIGGFIGGLVFTEMGITPPVAGMAGDIFVSFVGAVILLVILRIIRR